MPYPLSTGSRRRIDSQIVLIDGEMLASLMIDSGMGVFLAATYQVNPMRPIASEQDPLRYPLNEVLGTHAHVRLLRVMANEVEGPLTAADVAKRAGLSMPGAKKALEKLLQSGFICRVGGGRKHQYEIRRSERLMQIAIELFQAEKNRYEQLLAAIRKELDNLAPPPQAAWIQGAPREINEPLIVGLYHESLHLTECV